MYTLSPGMMETAGCALKDSRIVQDILYATGADNFQNQGNAAIVTMLTIGPPLSTRPKTGESLVAFRRRRLRVADCSQWSENENVRALQLQVDVKEHSKNHHTHKISIDDFPVNASTERKESLKWLTPATIHAEREKCQIYHSSEGLGGELVKRKLKNGTSSTNLFDISNEGPLTGLKSLTKRKQAKSVEEPAAIHQAFTETHLCEISKEKQAPSISSSMDSFTWRLGRNERLCRENLDMIDSLSYYPYKDPDKMKRAMISNWVIDVARER